MQFTQVWTEETKKLDLHKLDDSTKALEQPVLDRMCGKAALKKLRREAGWADMDEDSLKALEEACEALEASLRERKSTKLNVHRDDCADWEPQKLLALRLHYLARAKPIEDERTVPAQHVAPGIWYYKVPPDAHIEDWLPLRSKAQEHVYAMDDQDEADFVVPLRTSRGKAGGLNFSENYLTVLAERPENQYGDDRDEAPCLFSICDARHQFQPDFFHTTLPYFYDEDGELDTNVAFTQCPQHFHEMQDKLDYLDNNNAAFFRLNCMVRNCCGGVSSCGTNGMWLIPYREDDAIWQKRRKRVRDRDGRRRDELIEREQFHTSCKIEDTASSLDQVLVGRHSHFVNRKLSFGMAKNPTDFIGAQQRWVEGAVTLSLQWFTGNADAHGQARRNGWMLWVTLIFFLCFLGALIRLVTNEDTFFWVELGLMDEEQFQAYYSPVKQVVWDFFHHAPEVFKALGGTKLNKETFALLFTQFITWASCCLAAFLVLFLVTVTCKCFRRCCMFPHEMRWWGRLLISLDNLTYFAWFWTSFFWVGFNYYTALFRMDFHFNNQGMMGFMLVVNILNWGLLITNSFRYSVMQSVDANEVAALSMDNIWRSNQLFFMTGPLQLFSVVRGIGEFLKYKFYGQDIGGWSGGDLGRVSISIVKYWTTLILLGAVACWVCYFVYAKEYANSFPACIVVTLIALDVLHPCVFLWLGGVSLTEEEKGMPCLQCLTSARWWQVQVKNAIMTDMLTGLLKYLAPIYFFILPILALFSSYFGLTGAYMLVAIGPGH